VPDNIERIVAWLGELDPNLDAVTVAEAMWLSATMFPADGSLRLSGGSGANSDTSAENGIRSVSPEITDTQTVTDPSPVTESATSPATTKPGRSLYDTTSYLHETGPVRPGRRVQVDHGRSLPRPLELARSLRPFKRPWPMGLHFDLDLNATARSYAYTRKLIPEFRRGPERWFEAIVVIDESASMEVWSSAVTEFIRLLSQLAAFRMIHTWRLTVGDPVPKMRDRRGQLLRPDQVRSADGRRVVLVMSDYSNVGWRDGTVWQMLSGWAASTPTVLLNPLPTKLWHHTSLDLPAVRVGPGVPGCKNTRLRYHVPLLAQLSAGVGTSWMPLPVVTLTPHSLGRWAATLMRADPAGCDALLIPLSGRLHDAEDSDHPVLTAGQDLVDAFRRTASPAAVRLAVLCSPFTQISLPLLDLIRQTRVPEATVADVAEVIVGGPFISSSENGGMVLRFCDGAQECLQEMLSAHEAWQTYNALTQHVASHAGITSEFSVTVDDPYGDINIPAAIRPFAEASRETLRLLGVTAETRPLGRSRAAIAAMRLDPSQRPRWDRATPYSVRNAIKHAVGAGKVDELLEDTEFLVYADPATLWPELHHARTRRARLRAAIWRASADRHQHADSGVRRQLLSLDAARFGDRDLSERLARPADHPDPLPWFPVWSTGQEINPTLLAVLDAHGGWVRSVAMGESDGRLVAVASTAEGLLRVWDLTTGQLTTSLPAHEGAVNAVAARKMEGKLIVVSGGVDQKVLLWEVAADRPAPVLLGMHDDWVTAVAVAEYADDVIAVSGGRDGTLQTWRLDDGSPYGPQMVSSSLSGVWALAVGDAQGLVAVSGGRDGSMQVWDLATGNLRLNNLHAHEGPVNAVALSELDGRPVIVTCSHDQTIRVWDLVAGGLLKTLTGHTGAVTAVAVGVLDSHPVAVSGSRDRTVRVWDLRQGAEAGARPLVGHTGGITTMAVENLGALPVAVSSGADGTLRVWDLASDLLPQEPRIGHTDIVHAVAVHEVDGQAVVVSGGADGALRTWELSTSRPWRQPLEHRNGVVRAVAVTVLDRKPVTISGGDDGELEVWDLTTGKQYGRPLRRHRGWVWALGVGKIGGRPVVASCSDDETAQVWDLQTRKPHGPPLRSSGGWVTGVATGHLNSRQTIVTASHDGSVRLWDLTTVSDNGEPAPTLLDEVRIEPGMVTVTVKDSPDGLITIAGSSRGALRLWIWQPSAGKPDRRLLAGHTHDITALTIGKVEGRQVAASGSGDGTLRIWDLAGQLPPTVITLPTTPHAVAFAPDGRLVVGFGQEIAVFRPPLHSSRDRHHDDRR
jgi:WD40 repeat protein